MYNIVMIGPEGAGKGTQSERLADKLDIPAVSVGHLFRDEITNKTGLGQAIVEYIDKGQAVPDDITNQVMEGRLAEGDCAAGVILDGYPRTIAQQKILEGLFQKLDRKITHVIFLRLNDEEAVRRASGRWVCSNIKCEANYHVVMNPPKKDAALCDRCGNPLVQRHDDTPEAIRVRLELFHRETQSLIDQYRQQGLLLEIDGAQSIEKVEADIALALGLS